MIVFHFSEKQELMEILIVTLKTEEQNSHHYDDLPQKSFSKLLWSVNLKNLLLKTFWLIVKLTSKLKINIQLACVIEKSR